MQAVGTILPRVLAPVLLAGGAAHAAEVTDLPPRFRGDVHLAYQGLAQRVGLEQDNKVWGVRQHTVHALDLAAEAAVWDGVALRLSFPIAASDVISYPAAREMLFEPTTGEGSYVNGPQIAEPPELRAGGLQGVWIGLAAAPFREDYARGLDLTSRIDLAVRTPGATRYDAARGVSPGGVAVRLAAAFSVQRGPANPYFRAAFQWEGATRVDVVNPDDSAGGTVEVHGPTTVDALLGAELVGWKNTKDARFAVDLFAGVRYVGPERRPSGFWLPSVLDASKGLSVAQAEYVMVRGGLAFDVHVGRYVGLRFGGEGQWFTPHRVENPYAVVTDVQSFGASWTAALVGRIRLKGDRL